MGMKSYWITQWLLFNWVARINLNKLYWNRYIKVFLISLKRVEEKRKEKEFNLITSFGDEM